MAKQPRSAAGRIRASIDKLGINAAVEDIQRDVGLVNLFDKTGTHGMVLAPLGYIRAVRAQVRSRCERLGIPAPAGSVSCVQVVLAYAKPLAKVHPPIKLRFKSDLPPQMHELNNRALIVTGAIATRDDGDDCWNVEIDFEPLEERWIELHNGKPVRMGP